MPLDPTNWSNMQNCQDGTSFWGVTTFFSKSVYGDEIVVNNDKLDIYDPTNFMCYDKLTH